MRKDQQGISNRETAGEEEQERQEFPPVAPDAPPAEQDAAWAKALGDRFGRTELWLMPVRIEELLFTNQDFVWATQFAGQFFDQRAYHLTRSTPLRPKIDQNRFFRVYDLIKIRVGS